MNTRTLNAANSLKRKITNGENAVRGLRAVRKHFVTSNDSAMIVDENFIDALINEYEVEVKANKAKLKRL